LRKLALITFPGACYAPFCQEVPIAFTK